MMDDIRELNYEDRLSYQGLIILETRRLRGDLIHALKIIKASDSNELNNNCKLAGNNLRGRSLKPSKPRYNLNIRQFTFSSRVVDEWNLLRQHIIESSTTDTFKNNLIKCMAIRGLHRSLNLLPLATIVVLNV